jgi:hypothetical protein
MNSSAYGDGPARIDARRLRSPASAQEGGVDETECGSLFASRLRIKWQALGVLGMRRYAWVLNLRKLEQRASESFHLSTSLALNKAQLLF